MDRTQKEELVASFNDAFSEATLVVVTSQNGLTVAQSTELRQEMRNAGASFKVTKNRLTRLALKGTKFEHLSDLFKGPTGIAYSDDPVAAARVAVKFADNNDKFVVLGGGLDEQALDVSAVTALAKLPSLDELRGKLVGMIQTPATRIAGVTQAPAGQLARVISARAEQGEAA
ncbi:MAG: 50S ribosomal protein L10 [Alphaproteobacteria bacterium]|nr:50S ribosomal protein L10 [Alphaproteobacteria bacterium]